MCGEMKKKISILLIILFIFSFAIQLYFINPQYGWSDDYYVMKGSNPRIFQTENGKIVMIYDMSLFSKLNSSMVKSDDGVNWSNSQEIFEDYKAVVSNIFHENDQDWIIFVANRNIYISKFDDKHGFETPKKIHSIKAETQIIDDILYLDDDEFLFSNRMLKLFIFGGVSSSFTETQLIYIKSNDEKILKTFYGYSSCLYRDNNGKIWFLYHEATNDFFDSKISYITSEDGINWSELKEIKNSLGRTKDLSFYQTENGTYWLTYSFFKGESLFKEIYNQTSTDGENWSVPSRIFEEGLKTISSILELQDGKMIFVCFDGFEVMPSEIYVRIYDS